MADSAADVVIVGEDGTEHVFPPGFDPVKAAAIVRGPQAATWTRDHPTIAGLARGAVNTLPAVGAVAGGILGAPAAAATLNPVTGAAVEAGSVGLGAGAGRGLRDLIAEGLGLDVPSSPTDKAGRIALDAGEAAAAQAILPGLIQALKTPGATVREAVTTFESKLPDALRKFLPDLTPGQISGIANRPAPNITRPAELAWAPYLDTPKPVFTASETARGLSMIKSGMTEGQAQAAIMAQRGIKP